MRISVMFKGNTSSALIVRLYFRIVGAMANSMGLLVISERGFNFRELVL